jgi:putative transposase
MSNSLMPLSVTRTLRLKVRSESYAWLNAAAIEVNQVWNWANEVSAKAAQPFVGPREWLSGFDLNNLSAGATEYFERIGADTIQRINGEYAQKRIQAKRTKLRWRVSRGSRRSLGWIPFKTVSLKRKGHALRFAGKTFRVFESDRLEGAKWQQGCFAQDAVGDWWLCLPVEMPAEETVAPREAVGVDLGLKDIAVTSDGERLEAGKWTHRYAEQLANAQRRGHKRQAKRIHRKAARCRADALHKFSRSIVDSYQKIVIGDVSSLKLAKTKMAKSVLDSGWGMLKQMLQYKGEYAGRFVEVVNERNTTRVCSICGCASGPSGLRQLVVRAWRCQGCGTWHNRDANAARNILQFGLRCHPPGESADPADRASVGGNESSDLPIPSSRLRKGRRETGAESVRSAA